MATSENERERQQKVKSILREIKLGKENKIIEGINALKIYGDDSVITPIINLWAKGVSPAADQVIVNFLQDIKSSTSCAPIINALQEETYQNIHLPLLTIIWNSNVDYSEFLNDLINIAIEKDLNHTLECLTIIENMDGPFMEEQLLDAQIKLRKYTKEQQIHKTDGDSKLYLILEIAKLVENFESKTLE